MLTIVEYFDAQIEKVIEKKKKDFNKKEICNSFKF